jgi:hypothetical protein
MTWIREAKKWFCRRVAVHVQSSVDKQQVLIGAGFAIDVASEEIEPFSEPGIFAGIL